MAKRDIETQTGSHQRGEESRQRIIVAGLEVFGKYGFDGASTRMLAEKANVNLAAIPYYFGNKEGLYHAVAEHVAASIAERQGPMADKVAAALETDLSREQALELLHELLETFAATVIASDEADHWGRFIMREQMDPTPAFEVIYQTVIKRVHGVCAALIGRLLERPADDPQTLLRAFTIIGQILIFRAARAATQKRMGWDGFTSDRLEQIQAIVRENTDAILSPAGGLKP
ncbi:MAG: CerR family C-terminal domain-containing protein [Pseudomonadota bacterium]